MSDNEIIESLKICMNNGDCKECKINPHVGNYGYCTSLAIRAALDIINRQKAENERLQKYNTDIAFKHYNDGMKAFAERFKRRIGESEFPNVVIIGHINNLLKEMERKANE